MGINYRTINHYFSQYATPPISLTGVGFGRSELEAIRNIYQQKFNNITNVSIIINDENYIVNNFTQAAKILKKYGIQCSRKDIQRACDGRNVKKLSDVQIRRIV